MANVDSTAGLSEGLFTRHYVDQLLVRDVDMTKINAGSTLAVGDTADIITIPKGFVVEDVYVQVLTSGTTTSKFGLGNSSVADCYIAQVLADVTAGKIYKSGGSTAGGLHDVATVTTLGLQTSTTAPGFALAATAITPAASTIRLTQSVTANLIGKLRVIVRGYQLPLA